jgi:glycosyltransferase involved in cell wall biosynthesis
VPGRLTNYGTYLISSLVGIMKAERPDVVLTMTDPPFVAAAAMLASKVRHAPFVYVNQDIFPEVALTLGILKTGVTATTLRKLNARLRASAAAVVAIGRDMERRLLDLGTEPSKIRVITNWADTDAITPSSAASPLRDRLGWSDRFVVMHSGNVGLTQDLDALVGAADLLRDDPAVLIAIVGEGGSKAQLERAAQSRGLANVVFLPYQPKKNLTASLGAADLHFIGLRRGLAGAIVPSKLYGIMAVGRPFLAAVESESETALVCREFDCGLVVDPGSPHAIANGIRQARQLNLVAMGERGRDAAVAHFGRAAVAASYDSLLRDIVERNRPFPSRRSAS